MSKSLLWYLLLVLAKFMQSGLSHLLTFSGCDVCCALVFWTVVAPAPTFPDDVDVDDDDDDGDDDIVENEFAFRFCIL
jgi:hypothetical protein